MAEQGIYRSSRHFEIAEKSARPGQYPRSYVQAHVRRVEALRKAGIGAIDKETSGGDTAWDAMGSPIWRPGEDSRVEPKLLIRLASFIVACSSYPQSLPTAIVSASPHSRTEDRAVL